MAFGFDVISGSVFSYDSYVLGPGIDDDSFGADNVAGSLFPGDGAATVLLATLTLTGLAEGAGTLQTLGLYDGMFSGAFYENSGFDIDAQRGITVNLGGSVPEPETFFLLGTGLLGLAMFRRKKPLK